MIDTTDNQKKVKDDKKVVPETPVISNESKSDIQKALSMTDELANHCTFIFERNDISEESVDQEVLQKNFVEATKFSERKVSLHQLYAEEMEYLEKLQCRNMFFNMLAYGYKSFESIAVDIEMNDASFS